MTYAVTTCRPVLDPWERSRCIPPWQYLAETVEAGEPEHNHGPWLVMEPEAAREAVDKAIRDATREFRDWRTMLGVGDA